MKHRIIQYNEWIKPVMKGFLMECCDCGLVHSMDFKVTRKGNVKFRARRILQRRKR